MSFRVYQYSRTWLWQKWERHFFHTRAVTICANDKCSYQRGCFTKMHCISVWFNRIGLLSQLHSRSVATSRRHSSYAVKKIKQYFGPIRNMSLCDLPQRFYYRPHSPHRVYLQFPPWMVKTSNLSVLTNIWLESMCTHCSPTSDLFCNKASFAHT